MLTCTSAYGNSLDETADNTGQVSTPVNQVFGQDDWLVVRKTVPNCTVIANTEQKRPKIKIAEKWKLKIKRKLWEELIAYFSLTRHGPHRI
jgi:hypothetical protein